ncbi:MAG: Fe-Mn family superoxide dismutase [bacterium]
MTYEEKKFTIPELDGISTKSVEEHLGLYAGYVKNFNAISALLPEYAKDMDLPAGQAGKNAHALSELIRRRSFEFDGMRLHELYFAQFEGGAKALEAENPLSKQLEKEYMKAEHIEPYLKAIGNMRGPGWAILYWDPQAKQFLAGFAGEQHQGHFATLPIILALDVWEHAYLLDHGAAGKTKYIDAFFKNLNWGVIEERFAEVSN